MAETIVDLCERLKQPFLQEEQRGFLDDAVVGGLENLALPAPLQEVEAVIAGYGNLTPEARASRIAQALDIFANLASKNSARKTYPKQATSPNSSEFLAASDLDEPLDNGQVAFAAQAPKKLATMGLHTYRDLLFTFPKRYEDRRTLPAFANLSAEFSNNHEQQAVTAVGTITGRKANKSRRGMNILRVFLEDQHGARLTAVWFNQPWLEKQLFPGQTLFVTGKLKKSGRWLELNVSDFEVNDARDSISFGRIVPVYTIPQGINQGYLRKAITTFLASLGTVPDYLPKSILTRYNFVSLNTALHDIHFPADPNALQRALHRLKFDEFLFLELRVLLNRDTTLLGKQFEIREEELETFKNILPFSMTTAQKNASDEILADMARPKQMARLLQGDVGSGKTVVAALAMYVAVKNDKQAALMAPTEILARQHFINLQCYLYPLGVRLELLIGAMTSKEGKLAKARIANGEAQVVVGTHALIQADVKFADLGLAVVDEEHRFGVEQRRKLLANMPDVLVMSATPIPRSMALTYYGDLDLSIIDSLPPGRQPVETRMVNDSKRREVYHFAWGEIRKGRQVYLVTPLIEESEALEGIMASEQLYADLQQLMPAKCRLALLHGRMSAAEKDDIMQEFRAGNVDMLVSTTVIEVGVDVPNATVMIIENAERFGLSQLHQLRGRVGRGSYQSYCILVAGERSKKTQQRLEILVNHDDGFVIAEKDLALRGPGELRGTRQSGMPDLILGNLTQDIDIIEKARDFATRALEHDPTLKAAWAARLREELKRRSITLGLREII